MVATPVALEGYAAPMPTPAAASNAAQANTDALARIESAIPEISGRTLVNTSEVVDLLLDLRQLLASGQN